MKGAQKSGRRAETAGSPAKFEFSEPVFSNFRQKLRFIFADQLT